MPGKEHPRVREGRRKWDEREELGEEKKDEELLEPKWQPLRPPLRPLSTLLPALLFHISPSLPPSLALSISLFSCSLADLLRQGWRVQALQRLQCGDCMSCGSHSSLACRLHRQLLLQLILDQLALGSSAFQWSQAAATSDSGAECLINNPSKSRYGPYKAALNKNIWHMPELI